MYSLALVLIEAVTGRVPFAADTTIATLMARVDTPVEVSAELGPLRRVLERAGRPDPAERPDAGEFALGLLAASEELSRPEPLPLAGATSGAGDITIVDHDPTQLPPVRGSEPAIVASSPPPVVASASRRRRRWPLVAAAIAVVLALTAGAAFAWNNVLVASHKVPQLVKLSEQQATSAIQAKHWKVRKVDGRKDGSKKGEVIAQDPAEGEVARREQDRDDHRVVGQHVGHGPDRSRGQDPRRGHRRAHAGRLHARHPDQGRTTRPCPAGSVIGLDPATPPQLPKGDPVNVIVSDGPAPRTVPVIPPNSTFDQASAAITARPVGTDAPGRLQRHGARGSGRRHRVLPPGTAVARDSTVTIIVSKGLPTIPDVSGQSVHDAASQLQAAGFTVSGVQGNPFRTVTGTDPKAGTKAPSGTGVMIITRN